MSTISCSREGLRTQAGSSSSLATCKIVRQFSGRLEAALHCLAISSPENRKENEHVATATNL